MLGRLATRVAARPLFASVQRRYLVRSVETPEDYKSVVLGDKMVLAKFSASWCKPCQKAKPVVEELSNELSFLDFIEVDVDNLPQIADEEGVKTVPFFKLFRSGKLLEEVSGCDKAHLKDLISKHNAS